MSTTTVNIFYDLGSSDFFLGRVLLQNIPYHLLSGRDEASTWIENGAIKTLPLKLSKSIPLELWLNVLPQGEAGGINHLISGYRKAVRRP